jgi:hypothetical protein
MVMLKSSQTQTGSAHAVISIVLAVGLLGALGFIFWQNFINKDETKMESVSKTSQVESTKDAPDKEAALTAGTFDGATGTLQARGYLYTKDVPDPYCETNCATYTRAFFHIVESPNQSIGSYISDQKGNAFVEDSAVALGCVIDGKIQAAGIPSGEKIYSNTLSKLLVDSSKEMPVSIEIGRSTVPAGGDAPVCYSHFDSITLL